MDVMLVAVASVVIIIAVTALAPRAGVAAPLILVLVGVGVSVLPMTPAIEIDPELILAGVLPALLYAAAAAFPAMEFRRDFTAISGMSVLLVVVSAVILGAVFAAVVPGIGLAAGIALGAIVSPTDAVATSIIKKLGAPQRVVVMLDGEGLLNDATSLVLLRSAIAATAASVSVWSVLGDFLQAVLIAAVCGVVVGRLGLWVRARLRNAALSTAASFVVPFAAYAPAEALGASGIVAAVSAGLVTSALAARYLRPQDRISEASNWRTVEVLLEGGLFLVMGLQLFALVEDVRAEHGSLGLALGVATIGAVGIVLVRAAFVLPLLALLERRRRRAEQVRDVVNTLRARWDAHQEATDGGRLTVDAVVAAYAESLPPDIGERRRQRDVERMRRRVEGQWRRGDDPPRRRPDARRPTRRALFQRRAVRKLADIDYLTSAPLGPREGVVLVWAGMRGVVTLAAAQTLPADFPQRSLLVLVAFGVAAGTLLVQGGTLPWVVRRLGLAGSTPPRFTEGTQGLRAVHDTASRVMLDDPDLRRPDGTAYAPAIVARVRDIVLREHQDQVEEESTPEELAAQFFELRLAVIAAQREALLEARSVGTYDSDLLNHALDLLDADQIAVEMRRE
ncbi:sodium:proton antiporter [Isoptericola halotolerans]|uniref:CPA1 family monovalent cation:H+ antiporter n=1 Tax=Isoptericola halotolerans TaxID=300560 RepID=A0ABX2A6G3_9MICO|nr:cation:proton antiporter [Isoptericola halotolerans]NOV98442.1 CPA1 family monovalent cation:H+ antiporter [Isoptericola halotolerans]